MIKSRQSSSQHAAPAAPLGTSATLSIVVVSAGSPDVGLRATRVLANAVASGAAQVVFVHQGDTDPNALAAVRRRGIVTVAAAPGCTRAEMCDLGVQHVTGTIVTVRDAIDVGNAMWLSAFETLIPSLADRHLVGEQAIAVGERVVMDTMLPVFAAADERPEPRRQRTELAVPVAQAEMAAIM